MEMEYLLFGGTKLPHFPSHFPFPVTCLQLAARIAVSNLHKNTLKSFSQT